jgi:hypothetical protein
VTPTKPVFANIPTDELDVDDPAQFIIVKSRFKAILDTTAKAFLVPSRVVCSWFHETSGIAAHLVLQMLTPSAAEPLNRKVKREREKCTSEVVSWCWGQLTFSAGLGSFLACPGSFS